MRMIYRETLLFYERDNAIPHAVVITRGRAGPFKLWPFNVYVDGLLKGQVTTEIELTRLIDKIVELNHWTATP